VTPYVDDPDFTLYVGDVREVLAGLPDGSVNCVVTSPPYWGLRDYGTGLWEGGDEDCDHLGRPYQNPAVSTLTGHGPDGVSPYLANLRTHFRDVCGKCGARRVDQQLGLEPTPDAYVANMVEVFREVRRVLRADGTCWVNLGDSYATSGTRGYNGGEALAHMDAPQDAGYRGRPAGLKEKDLVGIPWRVARALQEPYYTGKIRNETDRVWLAATIEAEGCLFIHRRKVGQSNGQGYVRKNDSYGAGLEVSSTDRVIVERCQEITGIGSICEQTPETNPRRKQTIYRWNVRSNECRWVIRELYPHLLAKRHEARLLLGCPSSGDDARKAWASLKALHQGQSADIDFREPEGMWEEGWFLRSDIIWAKLDRTRCPRA
jgi:hypothetical protein